MKTFILIMIFTTQAMAGRITEVEYNPAKTQIRKYIAGDYFFGSSTTTAKSAYGVRISSNGGVWMKGIEVLENGNLYFDEVLMFYSRDAMKSIIEFGSPITIGVNVDMTENMTMIAGKTVDGRDISVDGAALDTAVTDIDNIKVSTGAIRADLTAHTGDSAIHYTQAAISISSSQVSGLESVIVNEAVYAQTAGTAAFVLTASSANYANNAGLLEDIASTGFVQNPSVADVDMAGYRILNSSTIPYSPTSETLVTGQYVADNTPSLDKVVIGTTTVQTTSLTMVEMGMRCTGFLSKEGVVLIDMIAICYAGKDKTAYFEIRCSTSSDYTAEKVIATGGYFVGKDNTPFTARLIGYNIITPDLVGKTLYSRMMWMTDGGTLTNYNGYADVPNRKAYIIFYPNADNIVYEEE